MPEREENCKKTKGKCCIDIIIFVLSILFAFTIGVIVGGVTGLLALLGLGAFIVLAIILLILIIIRILALLCCKLKC